MFGILRRTSVRQILAPALLACLVWMSVSSLLHSEDDDALCSPVVEHHDHSAHRIGAERPDPTDQPDHCFICHTQSLRSLVATATFSSPTAHPAPLVATVRTTAGVDVPQRQPARAPPLA